MVISAAILDKMVSEGTARKISDTAYEIITIPDLQKLAELNRSYSEGFNRRYQKRREKEIEASKRLFNEGPWYF